MTNWKYYLVDPINKLFYFGYWLTKYTFFGRKTKNNIGWKLDENNFFDEFHNVVTFSKYEFMNGEKIIQNWKKCCEIFEYTLNQNIGFKNMLRIIEYASAILGTNTKIVKIFSNILWSSKINRFLINTIKAIIYVKNYFKNYFVIDFIILWNIHNKLLNLINSL